MDSQIIELIHQGMQTLNEKCHSFEKSISNESINSVRYQEFYNLGITIIHQCCAQLEVHLGLDDVSLTNVNFYKEFRTPFLTGSYYKGVDFFVKEIRDNVEGEEVLLTDEEQLNREFTIHNCMSCMQLVPQQLAGNAKKYSISGQNVKVLLEKDLDYDTNTIYVSNIGPHCTNSEINTIVEEGVSGNEVRGANARDVAGMGIGLSEVKDIINLHEAILDTSFDISTNNKVVTVINEKEYSIFTTVISYLTKPKAAVRIPFSKKFSARIPIILLHNSVDIIANLIEATKVLKRIRYRGNEGFVSTVEQFQIEINKFQDLTKLCLFIRNNYKTDNLLGNVCSINIGNKIKDLVANICRNDYPDLLGDTIHIEGESLTIDVYSSIFPCLYGFFDYLLCQVSPLAAFDVIIDDYSVEIKCDDIKFKEIINAGKRETFRDDDYDNMRLKMYYSIFERNGFDMHLLTPHKLEITYRMEDYE